MLRLDDRWVWDFWTVTDGPDHHLFYLQAPRALGDPELRHHHATVGHAVSRDLRDWRVLADALGPGPPGSWDDLAVWTGSVIRADGRWAMLYTGIARSERGAIQRIGLATSHDLVRWRKHPANPVLEADERWYERLDASAWPEQAWRDPWLMFDPATGRFRALITARAAVGAADGGGVVAAAHSADLVHWTVGPPITDPGWYGHLEVPQVSHIGRRWYLTFSVEAERHAARHPDRIAGRALRSVRYRVADDPLGPFLAETDRLLVGDAAGSRYAGKIVHSARRHHLLTFRCFDANGAFRGEIDDPLPLIEVDGQLIVDG